MNNIDQIFIDKNIDQKLKRQKKNQKKNEQPQQYTSEKSNKQQPGGKRKLKISYYLNSKQDTKKNRN